MAPSSATVRATTKVGYDRVSTDHQSLAAQQDALIAQGCERIFTDTLSDTLSGAPR